MAVLVPAETLRPAALCFLMLFALVLDSGQKPPDLTVGWAQSCRFMEVCQRRGKLSVEQTNKVMDTVSKFFKVKSHKAN